ncbi:hypothetical protein ACFQ4Q_13975 [Lysobacter gummosus]
MLLFLIPSAVFARDLSEYPCTVFSYDVCFRLPTGTHANYSVPADFDVYTLSKGGASFATIYIGDAAQPSTSADAPVVKKTKYGTISIHAGDSSSSKGMVDIYIVPNAKDASTVHISADSAAADDEVLRELLSSFRPCVPIKAGGQKCPVNDVWSRELVQAIQ